MSYELRKRLHSPWSLYGSVVEHQRAESEGLKFDSSWGLRSFLCPKLVTRLKSSSFLNRAQNLPSLLFLANCLFMKLQLSVSAYMNALWIHSKNCCKLITHTYACIGSPERKNLHIYVYNLFARRKILIGKNCALCLEYSRKRAQFFPIRTDPRVGNNILHFTT